MKWETNQPAQRDFLRDFTSEATLYAGGWGCLDGNSPIDGTPGLRIGDVAESDAGAVVLSSYGRRTVRRGVAVRREWLFAVEMEDGRSFMASASHRVFSQGLWRCLSELQPGAYVLCLPESSAEPCPSAFPEGGETLVRRLFVPWDFPSLCGAEWGKIKRIMRDRYAWTYDIRVPHDGHYLSGGIFHHNSGKTWAGARKLLLLHQANRCPGMAIAPTWGDVWRIVVPAIHEAANSVRWPVSVGRGSAPQMIVGQHPIYLFSGDAPERITGVEVGHAWVDEAARISESKDPLRDAPTQIRGRLRHPSAKLLHLLATTTHEGSGTWVYRDWIDQPMPGHSIYQGRTADNDALPASYLKSRLETLSANLAAQYLDGGVADIAAGRAHPGFSKAEHMREVAADPRLPMHIGMDFNVSPLCWVLGQIHGAGNRATARVVVLDELVIPDHATIEQGMQMAHAKGWGNGVAINIHPDASSKNRSTTGNPIASDLARIGRSLGWPLIMRTLPSNPPINARISLVDAVISPWSKENRFSISPKCVRLARELQTVGRLKSGEYDPGKNGENGHILDAIGYWIWNELKPGGGMA